MKITKFQAANMREALAKIKRELGPEAMVISTRQVRRGFLGTGVEVTAAVDVDEPEPQGLAALPPASASSVMSSSAALAEEDVERIMAPLRSELRSLRSMLRTSGEARQSDELRRELAAMRRALATIQVERGQEVETDTASLRQLARQHRIASSSRGRVIALVGPTGVGKTTTIAKLAARAALIEHKSVAIITLDTYRIGGEEQMRIFADLIGVPLYLVADPADVSDQVRALADYDLIFIDTAGRSPRDVPAISALRRGLAQVDDLEIHLAVSASTPAATIDGIFARYQAMQIDRLLFTKLDEADNLEELVRAPARLAVPVSYVTTGQAVPEDIEVASAKRLLTLASAGLPVATEVAA